MLDGEKLFDEASRADYDVADRWIDEKDTARRCRVWDNAVAPLGMRLVRSINVVPATEDGLNEEDQSPGHGDPGSEGDPQLRQGRHRGPGRPGPVGVLDLPVPDPGAGRGGG